MKVILISAKSQHGKDITASIMKEELEKRGEKVLTIHFGDPVKFFAEKFYNWNLEKDEKGRELLQYIGTSLMRSYDKYYWSDMIAKFIHAAGLNGDFTYALIPDWRFYSEEEAIKKLFPLVYTLRINRYNKDGTLYKNPRMTEEQFTHISETELDKYSFDFIIRNSDTINKLKQSIYTVLDYIYEL